MSPRRGIWTRSASGSSSDRSGAGARPSTTARAAVDLGLRLAGAGRRPPPQPRQLGPGEVAPLALGRRPRARPARRGRRGTRRSRRRARARAAVELEDARRDPVEHVAVVGDEHEPAGEAGQPLLEPGDGVEVEVVGRLVQDEQVALGAVAQRHQRPGQRHPLGLAARQPADVGVEQVAEAEAVEHGLALPARRRPRRAPCPAGSTAIWSSVTTRAPRPRRTTPASGSTEPASTPSSVDFPEPLMPTTASRSPLGDRHRQVGEQRLAGSAHRHAGRVHEDHGSDGTGRPGIRPALRRRRSSTVATGVPGGPGSRHYRRPPMARGDGILSGPLDIDGPRRRQPTYPTVEGEAGLEVLHRATGVEGTIIGFEHGGVAIRDRNTRSRRLVRLDPGGFRVGGRSVTLVPPRPASIGAAGTPHRLGLDRGPRTTARVARASRILVEGVHDAELVEKVWGDDLRVEGVVVERLDGMDHLADVVDGLPPRARAAPRGAARPPRRRDQGGPGRRGRPSPARARHRHALRRRVAGGPAQGRRHRLVAAGAARASRGRRA